MKRAKWNKTHTTALLADYVILYQLDGWKHEDRRKFKSTYNCILIVIISAVMRDEDNKGFISKVGGCPVLHINYIILFISDLCFLCVI